MNTIIIYYWLINTVILSTHTQTQLFSQLLRTVFCFLHRSTRIHQSAAGPGPVMESPSAVWNIFPVWWASNRIRWFGSTSKSGWFGTFGLFFPYNWGLPSGKLRTMMIFHGILWWSIGFYFSINWQCHHPNWRTPIFQRGRSTTNQITINHH